MYLLLQYADAELGSVLYSQQLFFSTNLIFQ